MSELDRIKELAGIEIEKLDEAAENDVKGIATSDKIARLQKMRGLNIKDTEKHLAQAAESFAYALYIGWTVEVKTETPGVNQLSIKDYIISNSKKDITKDRMGQLMIDGFVKNTAKALQDIIKKIPK